MKETTTITIIDGVLSVIDVGLITTLLIAQTHVTCCFQAARTEATQGKLLSKKVRLGTSLCGVLLLLLMLALVANNFALSLNTLVSNPRTIAAMFLIQEIAGVVLINTTLLTIARFHCASLIGVVKDTVIKRRSTATKVQVSLFIFELLLGVSSVIPKIIVDIKYYTEAGNSAILIPSSLIFIVKQIFDRYFDLALAINTLAVMMVSIWFTAYYLESSESSRKPFIQASIMTFAFVLYVFFRTVFVYAKLGVDLRDRMIISSSTTRIWWFHSMTIAQCILIGIHWAMVGPLTTKKEVAVKDSSWNLMHDTEMINDEDKGSTPA